MACRRDALSAEALDGVLIFLAGGAVKADAATAVLMQAGIVLRQSGGVGEEEQFVQRGIAQFGLGRVVCALVAAGLLRR